MLNYLHTHTHTHTHWATHPVAEGGMEFLNFPIYISENSSTCSSPPDALRKNNGKKEQKTHLQNLQSART